MYCHIDLARLQGYHMACKNLQGEVEAQQSRKESLYEQAEEARNNNFKVSTIYIIYRGGLYYKYYIQGGEVEVQQSRKESLYEQAEEARINNVKVSTIQL